MSEIDLLAEVDPPCPRGCGRSFDDCYEAEDGEDCAGSRVVQDLEHDNAKRMRIIGSLEAQLADARAEAERLRQAVRRAEDDAAEQRIAVGVFIEGMKRRQEELDRTRPVVEAARALREAESASPYLGAPPELVDLIAAVDALGAAGEQTAGACGSCGGVRWVDDENRQPEDYERAEGRVPGSGRIPCGSCNHGGWDVPDELSDAERKIRARLAASRAQAGEEVGS